MGLNNLELWASRGKAYDLFPYASAGADEIYRRHTSAIIHRFLALRSYECIRNEKNLIFSPSMASELIEAFVHGQIGIEIADPGKTTGKNLFPQVKTLWPPTEQLGAGRQLLFESQVLIVTVHPDVEFGDLLIPDSGDPGTTSGDTKFAQLFSLHDSLPFEAGEVSKLIDEARLEVENFAPPGSNQLLRLGRITTQTALYLGLPDFSFPLPISPTR